MTARRMLVARDRQAADDVPVEVGDVHRGVRITADGP